MGILAVTVGRGGTWGSLFDLSDVHVMGHVTARGPSCRCLLRAVEPLRFFLIEHHMYHFHKPAQRLTLLLLNRSRNWIGL